MIRGGRAKRESQSSRENAEPVAAPVIAAPPSQPLVNAESSDDDEDCSLCCGPLDTRALVSCQHSGQVCGRCVLRLRLFPTKPSKPSDSPPPAFQWCCPYCRQQWADVFISETDQDFDRLLANKSSMEFDPDVELWFTQPALKVLFHRMRSFYCLCCIPPQVSIDLLVPEPQFKPFANLQQLESHLKSKHHRQLWFVS